MHIFTILLIHVYKHASFWYTFTNMHPFNTLLQTCILLIHLLPYSFRIRQKSYMWKLQRFAIWNLNANIVWNRLRQSFIQLIQRSTALLQNVFNIPLCGKVYISNVDFTTNPVFFFGILAHAFIIYSQYSGKS